MGQAFDGNGRLLGEAFGETKWDVFDQLMQKYGDADEIRIRSMQAASNGPSVQMPRYKCHKEVFALKIRDVVDPTLPGNETDGSRVLHFEDSAYSPMRVNHDYARKHKPSAGGYYVVYDDGYASFSPAKAFEEGYTRI